MDEGEFMYNICLSLEAKEELFNKKEKELFKVNDTIEDLKKGLWKNGTRVKKLHAVNKKKCIYEARVDKARRMLFSVQKQSGNLEPLIFIYNIIVEHDRVIRTAQSILGENYTEELYISDEKSERIETIESLVENEKIHYPEQSQIFSILDDVKSYEFTEDDLLRILYKDNITEDDLIDFKLRLTKEQKELINKSLPMLIAGTAGSGKTTILIYKMLCNPSQSKIYISYNDRLCKEAKKNFSYLVKGNDHEKEYIENTHFSTFEEILNKFYGNLTKTIMTKERFISEYLKYSRGNQLDKKFPPLMVWEELRGVLKVNKNNSEIPLDQYLQIPKEEAPNFFNSREESYKIYKWYDNYLKDNYIEDELDLIRGFINSDGNFSKEYSMIVCDEVQDLTNLHIMFLFKMAGYNPQRLLIAGDDHQIINHSGFRWENVKNLFYNELNNSKVELYKLNKNFRCAGNISNLANSVNELQKDFVDIRYKTKTINSSVSGEKPILLYNIKEADIIHYFKGLGPTQAIIVKDGVEQELLKETFIKQYNFVPLIFTIEEVKGLEFELVVLWKLAKDRFNSNENWEKIFRRKKAGLDGRLKKFVRYETSLIYVAITRAIKKCIIYDGEHPGKLWTIDKIVEKINFEVSLSKLNSIKKEVFSDLDWFNQGKKLFNKELYSQALECFKRSGNIKPIVQKEKYIKMCEAKLLVNRGELEAAGDIYLNINLLDEAEKCFDSGFYYDKLINIFGTQKYGYKDIAKYNTYSIKKYDNLKNWHRSAMFCNLSKRYGDAIVRFKRSEEYKIAANIAENKINDYKDAIELYILANDINGINRCKQKHKNGKTIYEKYFFDFVPTYEGNCIIVFTNLFDEKVIIRISTGDDNNFVTKKINNPLSYFNSVNQILELDTMKKGVYKSIKELPDFSKINKQTDLNNIIKY